MRLKLLDWLVGVILAVAGLAALLWLGRSSGGLEAELDEFEG